MKNSNNTIENGTRDLPAYSTVPQPTAPSHSPRFWQIRPNKSCYTVLSHSFSSECISTVAIKLGKVLFHILNFAHFIFKLEGGRGPP